VVLANAIPAVGKYEAIQWSPSGEAILYSSEDGLSMVSPDGSTVRKLAARKLQAYGFSRDGTQVYGFFQNTTGKGAEWQLWSIDARTGAEKLLAPMEFPASTGSIAGFSLHPEGKRFLTLIAVWPFRLWTLEGFDQPVRNTLVSRLLGR
jgi:hypothetical protein